MGKEMFAGRKDSARKVICLHAADVGGTKAPRQDRVLSVGFFEPAPARVASDVEDGRQALAGTDGHKLAAYRVGHFLDHVRIPAARQAERLRERRGVAGAITGDGLLVHDHGDPETRSPDDRLLDFVNYRRALSRAQARRCPYPGYLADAVRYGRECGDCVETLLFDKVREPHSSQLGDLFIELHPTYEVVGTFDHRQAGIAVRSSTHWSPP
jgi:hypothetical protein